MPYPSPYPTSAIEFVRKGGKKAMANSAKSDVGHLWGARDCFYIVELTVPWEDAVEKVEEHKSLKYAELAADAEHHG